MSFAQPVHAIPVSDDSPDRPVSLSPGVVGIAITFGAIAVLLGTLAALEMGGYGWLALSIWAGLALAIGWLVPLGIVWTACRQLNCRLPLHWTVAAALAFATTVWVMYGRSLGPSFVDNAQYFKAVLWDDTPLHEFFKRLYIVTGLVGAILWCIVGAKALLGRAGETTTAPPATKDADRAAWALTLAEGLRAMLAGLFIMALTALVVGAADAWPAAATGLGFLPGALASLGPPIAAICTVVGTWMLTTPLRGAQLAADRIRQGVRISLLLALAVSVAAVVVFWAEEPAHYRYLWIVVQPGICLAALIYLGMLGKDLLDELLARTCAVAAWAFAGLGVLAILPVATHLHPAVAAFAAGALALGMALAFLRGWWILMRFSAHSRGEQPVLRFPLRAEVTVALAALALRFLDVKSGIGLSSALEAAVLALTVPLVLAALALAQRKLLRESLWTAFVGFVIVGFVAVLSRIL